MGNYINPFAPTAYLGVGAQNNRVGSEDRVFVPTYEVTLDANQVITGAQVQLPTQAIFALRGIMLSAFTGDFRVRFQDDSGRYINSGFLNQQVFLYGFEPSIFPISPELVFSGGGGRITIDITDTSGATNVIQFAFLGVNRFRV